MKNAYQMPLVFRRELFRGLFFAGLLMSGCATAQSDIETDFEDRSAKLAEIAATRSALVAQVRELAQLERELLTTQGNERVIFNEISRSGEVVPGIDSLPVIVHVERITSAELQQPTPKLGVSGGWR